jgi:chromosome segregation protein
LPAIVKEVILENFMSYKYARIPLAPGINVVTGPNGSGKSSILLGMAVALGQTYTERGRRLSDLIRRGEEAARATVVVDNRPVDGKRPLPWFRSDEVFFTRYLRLDGQYWHEVNGRVVSKAEVRRYLSRIGLDPDNALIIMHQNMVEEFAFLTPQERLRLLEDAVGLAGYRERVASAKKMLEEGVRGAEEAKAALAKAEEALKFWSEVYERYKRRKALEERVAHLKAELAWARVRDALAELREAEEQAAKVEGELRGVERELEELGTRERSLRGAIEGIEGELLSGTLGVEEGLKRLRGVWEELLEVAASSRVKAFERRLLIAELEELKVRQRRLSEKVKALRAKAEQEGSEVSTLRSVEEVETELHAAELELAGIGEVPPEVESAYAKLEESYRELVRRAEELEENKKRLVEELEKRVALWREKVSAVVADVDREFSSMLARLGASGSVRLVEEVDVERAGLEVFVSFGGSSPAPFNPYALSGGERTAAIMCFFLALQNHVRSPFRAVDEFDVHMDPRNRDAILSMVFELASRNSGVQYVVITPGPLTKLPESSNVLVVQKVRGRSLVSLARGGAQ